MTSLPSFSTISPPITGVSPMTLSVAPPPTIPEGASVWDLSSILDDPTVRASITYTYDIINLLKDPKGAEYLSRSGIVSPEIQALRWAKSVNAWASGLPGSVDPTKDPEATRKHLLYLWNLGLITQATEGGKLDPRKPDDYAKIKRNYVYLLQQARADDDRISVHDLQKMYTNFAATVPLPPGDPRTVRTFWEWLKHPQLGSWAKLGLLFGIPASLIGITSAIMTRKVNPWTLLMILALPVAGLGAYYSYSQDTKSYKYQKALEQDIASILSTLGYRRTVSQIPSSVSAVTNQPNIPPSANKSNSDTAKQADFRELPALLGLHQCKQALQFRISGFGRPTSGTSTSVFMSPKSKVPSLGSQFGTSIAGPSVAFRVGSAFGTPAQGTPVRPDQVQQSQAFNQVRQPQSFNQVQQPQSPKWTVQNILESGPWQYVDQLDQNQKGQLLAMVESAPGLEPRQKQILQTAIENSDRGWSRWLVESTLMNRLRAAIQTNPQLKSQEPLTALQFLLSSQK